LEPCVFLGIYRALPPASSSLFFLTTSSCYFEQAVASVLDSSRCFLETDGKHIVRQVESALKAICNVTLPPNQHTSSSWQDDYNLAVEGLQFPPTSCPDVHYPTDQVHKEVRGFKTIILILLQKLTLTIRMRTYAEQLDFALTFRAS
jgi:hypothetical protein